MFFIIIIKNGCKVLLKIVKLSRDIWKIIHKSYEMAKLLKNSDAKLKGLMIQSMLASYRIRSLAIYVVMIKRGYPDESY